MRQQYVYLYPLPSLSPREVESQQHSDGWVARLHDRLERTHDRLVVSWDAIKRAEMLLTDAHDCLTRLSY